MSVYASLTQVQGALKAPKNQFNSFGKYKYRSCEDIIEAAKPLCIKNGLCLTVSDEVTEVGGRVYVKATAIIKDVETGEAVSVSAFAREPNDKKGMDESQITGTASSYARKYALNGLFAIDDTKDADTDEHREQQSRPAPKQRPKPVNDIEPAPNAKSSHALKKEGVWQEFMDELNGCETLAEVEHCKHSWREKAREKQLNGAFTSSMKEEFEKHVAHIQAIQQVGDPNRAVV